MPYEFLRWQAAEDRASEIAQAYGFRPLRTPHIEQAEIFRPTLGETSDIVEKQMYSFKTRGGDNLVLRPEWTVPAVRAYFEHGMHSWPQPVMLYTHGSFFRHESPQKGRFREFGQFDLEILGDEAAFSDALIIRVICLIFQEIGLKNFITHINTLGDKECRPEFRKELVAYYRRKINSLCQDCKRRLKENPLRLLDCKQPSCLELRNEAPKMIDFSCQSCRSHFKSVLEFLDELAIPYFLNPHLVRGLDYYSRTVFEILSEPAAREKKDAEEQIPALPLALASGGRYDYLAENLGQKKLFGVGGAIGLDRLMDELTARKVEVVKIKKPDISLIQIGPQAKKTTLALFEVLRKAKFNIAQSFAKDNLRQQLYLADKSGSSAALIIGQKEALDGTIIVRDMISGSQETILQDKIVDHLKKKLKNRQKP